jgi:phospholipase/carboxylesterase
MNLISTTLLHKIRPPASHMHEKPPALVLLHGRGTNEDDLLGLVDYLDPRFFVISARAPYPFQDGYGGYTWYDLRDIGSPDLAQFDDSTARLVRFLADIKSGYPVDAERVFLLGFSMGSVMSFAAGLTVPGIVRGIVAHSGYIPEKTNQNFAWDRLHGLSVFVAHGIHDPVIPIEYGRRAKELLAASTADVEYKEYPIPHTISEQSLADLSSWLQIKLDVPADMK